ncbi:hypothetical protein NP493_297g03009 [Ridgeia piscesae]|uniref:Vasculin n=1 Tax=Ridgeia piscesae TaxID=27915 RepID=A0AAD9UBE3_RIDPI|nr:hypothetical protein NP493_297g03009 [Ridgeia piscesae]
MANSKAPKHDFAPAWLKVPDHESWKSSGPKPSEQPSTRPSRPSRRDDYYNGYSRPDYCMPLQRQHSFDNYYDDRRYPPQKFRHHSVDDDYYGYGCYGGYYEGYGYDKYVGPHYRSHPGLYQDGKYTHPNARYGQTGPQVNGGGAYPPYYGPYMYDYYQGGPYYGNYPTNKRRPMVDKSDGRYRNGRERRHSDSRSGGSKQNSLDDDFPSLNGEADGEKENSGGSKTGTLGAWGKSPAGTMNGTARNTRDDRADDFVHLSSKHLNKSSVRVYKDSFGDKELPSKPLSSNDARKDVNSNSTTAAPPGDQSHIGSNGHASDTEGNQSAENGAVETSGGNNGKPEADEPLVRGINDLSMSSVERSLLSSSLEAEQRLLREMGWNDDEEEYVITEDDLREFQKLKQMKQQKNGLQCGRTKVWSPQRIGVLPVVPPQKLVDSPCSSSDDDDDTDLD